LSFAFFLFCRSVTDAFTVYLPNFNGSPDGICPARLLQKNGFYHLITSANLILRPQFAKKSLRAITLIIRHILKFATARLKKNDAVVKNFYTFAR
jgi:hypothetical protein